MFVKIKTLVPLITILCLLSVTACSSLDKKDSSSGKKTNILENNRSPEKIYELANSQMQSKRYNEALEEYETLLIEYPFGSLSETARLERIFVLNKLNSTEEASEAAEQFIRQYPLHPNVDYAYFMRGLVKFERKSGFILGRGANEVARNKHSMQQSYNAFSELIQKHPTSRYAADAKQRMVYLRNKMAEHELSVANFYVERNANIGVINRCQYILDNYDNTPAVFDALKLMIKTYNKMELNDLADQAQTVLDLNIQNSASQASTEAKEKPSIWSKLPSLNPFNNK